MHQQSQILEIPYPALSVAWRSAGILFVLYLLATLDKNLLNLLVGPIKQDLQLTDVQLSLVIGLAYALFYSLAALPIGWAIDRYSRRKVIFTCVVCWSLATAGCGLASSFLMLFLARTGVGAAEAAIMPGAQSILADSFPPTKLALPISILALGAKLGQAASLLVGGALTALLPPAELFTVPFVDLTLKGWQAIFMVVGLPGIVIALLIFAMPEPPRRVASNVSRDVGYGEYFKFVKRFPKLILLSHLGCVIFFAAVVSVESWAPAHIERAFGWEASRTGAMLGASLLIGALVGIPLPGYIADRLFQRGVSDVHMRYMMIAALVGLPIGIAAFTVTHPLLCVALIGLFFAVVSCFISMPMVTLQLLLPSHLRGKGAAILIMTAGIFGSTIGPMIVAMLTDWVFRDPQKVGWSVAMSLTLLLPLASLVYGSALGGMRKALVATQDPLLTAGR